MNEFMTDIYNKLIEDNKSKSTAQTYINNLKNIFQNINKKNLNKLYTNFNFLKKTDDVINYLSKFSDNTKKNYLSAILSINKLLNLNNKKSFKKPIDIYNNEFLKYRKILNDKSNNKTEKQKENWITWEDIENKRKEYHTQFLDLITHNKKKVKLDEKLYKDLCKYLLLSLYTLLPPRRLLDYNQMKIVRKYKDDMNKDFNYFSLSENKFIFNNYKTKKTYETQKIDIPCNLINIIKLYLKFNPHTNKIKYFNKNMCVPFLSNIDETPFQSNRITRLLNETFKPKKISVNMIRNIYNTDKYCDVVGEMSENAEKMGHSVNTKLKYYIKTDN